MATSGISTSSLFNYENSSTPTRREQFQQDFQQLGQDLQSGNLSAAQSDFASLEQIAPNSLTTQNSSNPATQAFNQLAQDLQSGNLTAAQQDYANIRQDFQKSAETRHHHHHGGGSGDDSSTMSQLFQELGQALQSGNVSSAQQIFSTLQQDMQTSANGTSGSELNPLTTSSVSVTA